VIKVGIKRLLKQAHPCRRRHLSLQPVQGNALGLEPDGSSPSGEGWEDESSDGNNYCEDSEESGSEEPLVVDFTKQQIRNEMLVRNSVRGAPSFTRFNTYKNFYEIPKRKRRPALKESADADFTTYPEGMFVRYALGFKEIYRKMYRLLEFIHEHPESKTRDVSDTIRSFCYRINPRYGYLKVPVSRRGPQHQPTAMQGLLFSVLSRTPTFQVVA